MCIGIPMQVINADGQACALAAGRVGVRRITTRLVGDCRPGDWLLVFLDDARERLSAERAAEIDAVLDLLGAALAADGAPTLTPTDQPAFALPSAMAADSLFALLGVDSTRQETA